MTAQALLRPRAAARIFGARMSDALPTTAEEWIEHLNREYAVMLTGGKTLVLREIRQKGRPHDLEFLSLDAFRAWLGPYAVYSGADDNRKRHAIANSWLRSPKQRRYDGLTFDPHPHADDHRYNLWRGWAVEPSPADGLPLLFEDHLLSVVCRGRPDDYKWLYSWFAQLVQDPKTKDGTAVLLRGAQGTGKTIVGQIIGHLCGPHYLMTADPRYLTGRFNAHLARCLLLQLEEAVWGGSHEAAGKLKGLITAPTIPVEYKGRETIDMPNYTRVLLTSNAGWAIPAALDDRRFAVFDLDDSHRNDRAYFGRMLEELHDGGYQQLLHNLLRWPLRESRILTPPRTAGLYEQALRSLPPEDQWYVDLLSAGELPGDRATEGVVAKSDLYDDYIRAMQARNVPHRLSRDSLGMALVRLCPGLQTRERESTGYQRRWLYRFPSLESCRSSIKAQWQSLILWPTGNSEWQPSRVERPGQGGRTSQPYEP